MKRARSARVPARPLWRCPRCGRRFANHNQAHSCGRFSLREHLRGKNPRVIALYRKFCWLVRRCGPFIHAPVKTRIGFQARMTFADVILKKEWLDAYVILARWRSSPRFTRIQSISPRNHVHYFRLRRLKELDGEVLSWLREAYAVGQQKHLRR